jgi:hypothetical protein
MWKTIKGWFGKKPEVPRATPGPAQWIPEDKNPFGFPILDLVSITGDLISTSKSPLEAETSMSWSGRFVKDLPMDMTPVKSLSCCLRYPVDPDLQDGWLFCPSCMEEKWAIAHRAGKLLLMRSWSGNLSALADTRREGQDIVVERVQLADETFEIFGDPVQAIDWLLRSHALGEVLPLPVCEEGAQLLESVPLMVFGPYGRRAAYAATTWAPPVPERPMRATSDLLTAVRIEDSARVAALAKASCSLDARSPVLGYTALHVAVVKGNLALCRQLLDLGADPNVLGDREASVAGTAMVHKAPLELLKLLAARGADLRRANVDGFGLLHAMAEVDHPAPLAWLLEQGLALEARTHKGLTPLHIAAGLGHEQALKALLDAGADAQAAAPSGETARDFATKEGKAAAVAILDAHKRPN